MHQVADRPYALRRRAQSGVSDHPPPIEPDSDLLKSKAGRVRLSPDRYQNGIRCQNLASVQDDLGMVGVLIDRLYPGSRPQIDPAVAEGPW